MGAEGVILVVVLLALGVPFVMISLAAMWEQRLVWPYAAMEEPLEPTPYMAAVAALAQSMGMRRIGVWRHDGHRMYRVRYEFWSPTEGDALVLIGGGRFGAIRVDATWLFTRLGDGRCLVTIDNPMGSEYDLSGVRDEALYPGAGLRELLERHRGRAAERGLALPYSREDPMSEHRDLMNRRVEMLVQRECAQFLDRSRGTWRYTRRGAVRVALGLTWTTLRRRLPRPAV